ncbi:aspartyl/glutamyl-tRNA amidotransferase subunit B [Candidatus Gottesmanbacteria bacterium]|nr:aspartyl/glutamyl-tRNA amidotransferase subunit B [Candidatus Gottesmanbacteria bacterium]
MGKYEPIIGLEIHVELATASKMFCGCKNDPFFASDPNIYTCPVCLGMPGGLPVPNKKAVEFYPDLPKGYQISQYDKPLAIHGSLEIFNYPINQSTNNQIKEKIRIRRVHIEEDTGKLIHATIEGKRVSLVDFNRSGVPLVEVVTEPDFRTVEEVDQFLKKLQQIIRYLSISGADMEKGSMRLEPSISILPITNTTNNPIIQYPTYRVELKNINSFRFARKAIEYEIERQTAMLDRGEQPIQQTRGWSEDKGVTLPQRAKEEAQDYRYFPEPDIPPMRWEKSQISKLKSQIPELPDQKKERFMKTYGLSDYDSDLITETRKLADYFEEAVKVAESTLDTGNQHIKQHHISPKKIANWMINKQPDIDAILPSQLVQDIRAASLVVDVSIDEITGAIEQVVREQSKAMSDYQKGKEQALMFLLGQVIKELKGKGDKQIITEKLKEKLALYGR